MGRNRVMGIGKNSQRYMYVSGGVEARLTYELRVGIHWSGNIENISFSLRDTSDMKKKRIRYKDRIWVALNIPSSIWWNTEIHHDWEDGVKMYLLTKGEHLEREKWIRKQKKESKNV